jgi:hypothetical protein
MCLGTGCCSEALADEVFGRIFDKSVKVQRGWRAAMVALLVWLISS